MGRRAKDLFFSLGRALIPPGHDGPEIARHFLWMSKLPPPPLGRTIFVFLRRREEAASWTGRRCLEEGWYNNGRPARGLRAARALVYCPLGDFRRAFLNREAAPTAEAVGLFSLPAKRIFWSAVSERPLLPA